jgi:hypothetical protein
MARTSVAEVLRGAMRITEADDNEDWAIAIRGDELARLLRHERDVAIAGTLGCQLGIERQRAIGKNVFLADEGGPVARGF